MLSILRHMMRAYSRNKATRGVSGWAVFVTWLLGGVAAIALFGAVMVVAGVRDWLSVFLDLTAFVPGILLARLIFFLAGRKIASGSRARDGDRGQRNSGTQK